jgi:N6-adenosine-specific RNA methylase IME4
MIVPPIHMYEISKIKIGPRIRKTLGDIHALADSIDEFGLLHPIGLNKDGTLLFGERRIEAALQLGWSRIPARVLDMLDIVLVEQAENELRKNFTVSERVAIGKALEERVGKRQGQRTDLQLPQNFGEVPKGKETAEIAATKAGFGNVETYRQAKAVVDKGAPELVSLLDEGKVSVTLAAELLKAPADFQHSVLEKLQAGEAIDGIDAVRQAKRAENAARRAEILNGPVCIPEGKYRCLVIDPPWPMEKIERDERPKQVGFDYPTMTESELAAFPLPEYAAPDCHLYLWTTHKFLPMALRLAEHWGFRYQCLLTWVKNVGFTPFSWMYSTEHALFCRTGNLPLRALGKRLDFAAPVREHSRKPEAFYDLVRAVSPGPRLDIFSREHHAGFAQYGNEVEKFAWEHTG